MAAAKKGGSPPDKRKGRSDQSTTPTSARQSARSKKKEENSRRFREVSAAARAEVASTKALLQSAAGSAPDVVYDEAKGYTPQLNAWLFKLVATAHSLDYIAAQPGMPPLWLLLEWLDTEGHPFGTTYAEAKQRLVPLLEERAISAASQPLLGTVVTKKQVLDKNGALVDVEEVRTFDNVERSKLVVTAYQWTLAHLRPKKHGRQADPDGGSNDGLKDLLGQFRERNKQIKEGES